MTTKTTTTMMMRKKISFQILYKSKHINDTFFAVKKSENSCVGLMALGQCKSARGKKGREREREPYNETEGMIIKIEYTKLFSRIGLINRNLLMIFRAFISAPER